MSADQYTVLVSACTPPAGNIGMSLESADNALSKNIIFSDVLTR